MTCFMLNRIESLTTIILVSVFIHLYIFLYVTSHKVNRLISKDVFKSIDAWANKSACQEEKRFYINPMIFPKKLLKIYTIMA